MGCFTVTTETQDRLPRTPASLSISKDVVINADMSQPLGFYPREDYLLVEVTGRIKMFEVRKFIEKYSRQNRTKPVAIRGIGPRNIETAVVMSHLIINDAKATVYHQDVAAQTFSAMNQSKQGKLMTGIQIILFPVAAEEEN